MKTAVKLLATIFLIGMGFILPNTTFAAGVNCPDFSTWKDAQNYFESHGGSPTNNVEGLDRDHDGIACEENPGYTGQTWADLHPAGGGAQTPTPQPAPTPTPHPTPMPKTATPYATELILGLIGLFGTVLFLFRRKKA